MLFPFLEIHFPGANKYSMNADIFKSFQRHKVSLNNCDCNSSNSTPLKCKGADCLDTQLLLIEVLNSNAMYLFL
jgi:hypothetical protein